LHDTVQLCGASLPNPCTLHCSISRHQPEAPATRTSDESTFPVIVLVSGAAAALATAWVAALLGKLTLHDASEATYPEYHLTRIDSSRR
jgi:hypothetical protein